MQVTKLICPTCAAKIQIARVLPRGAKGRCPRCGTVFAVPEPEELRAGAPATMAARPQLVDDETAEEGGEGRRRRRRKQAASGTKSYTALIVAIVLVVGFVGVLGYVFYDAAFAPYRNTPDIIIPTLPTQTNQGSSAAK